MENIEKTNKRKNQGCHPEKYQSGYTFIEPLPNESYQTYIQRILNSRENIRQKKYYQERHHIQPKCLGRTNSDDNLVYLFAEEHYYAHKLLYEENPHNRDLVYGWHCVSTKKGLKISAEEYSYVKQVYSDSLKEFHPSRGVPVKEEVKKRISETLKGRKDSPATIEKKRQRLLRDNIAKKEEVRKKMSLNHADFNGEKSGKAQPIKNLITGEVFGSVVDAAIALNLKRTTIQAWVNGTVKSHEEWVRITKEQYQQIKKEKEESKNES